MLIFLAGSSPSLSHLTTSLAAAWRAENVLAVRSLKRSGGISSAIEQSVIAKVMREIFFIRGITISAAKIKLIV